MRSTWILSVPMLASLAAIPAAGQVSTRVHIDVPIGRPGAVVYNAPRRQVVVREYDQSRFGAWDQYYDEWAPETLYYYDGYYYDYPIVAYAEPISVFRFRNEFFFAPRQREFISWQQRFRGRDFQRNVYRPAPRFDRDDHRYQAPRNDRYQPQRDDRNGRDNGRDVRPMQPRRDGRDVRPTQPQSQHQDRGGRQGPPQRDEGRSRPRPH